MTRLWLLAALATVVACGGKTSQPAAPAPAPAAAPAPTPAPAPAPVATPAPDPTKELLAAETAAYDKAKPVFAKYCAGCHTKDGKNASKKKLDHFTLDTYPFGGHHTATIGFTIRDVLGISGKKPTMPYSKPGSVQGDDLATIRAWTDAWEAADKAGAHGAHGPADHDDDDDDDHH